MCNPHRAAHFVYMLTARTARPVKIYPNVIFTYIDVVILVMFGYNVDSRKARMPSALGIERAYSHKSMNARLTRKLPKRKRPCYPQRSGPYTRLFSRCYIEFFIFVLVRLKVTRVHSQKHVGPVTALRTPCTCMNAEKTVSHVIRPAQHPPYLNLFTLF